MGNVLELNQIIYCLLASQIEFGTYQYKDFLPKMEEVSRWFSVSLDTVKTAYRQLKTDGYITLTKKAGAAVAVQFQEAELEENIQTFFSRRRDAVMDLCQSLGPLFSRAQWLAMKRAEPERLDELERLCAPSEILKPYVMVQHIQLIYGSLNNELLLRFIWQAYIFYQAPFLSLPENLTAFEDGDGPLLHMIGLCRRTDWDGLWQSVISFQEQLASSIRRFYANRINKKTEGEPVSFTWNAYRKSSQRCYSIAIELLKEVRQGILAPDGFLPPPARIAEYKQVSATTVRRTLMLLNQLGVTQSINGVGTKVLSTQDSAENCDFNQPVIRKRLLDFIQSLQILAITCGDWAKEVVVDAGAVSLWKDRLAYIKENGRYESVVFASLEIITLYSPIQTVRHLYGHLVCFLLWGYSLRSMHGSREEINNFYLPYITSLSASLEHSDWEGLSEELERLILHELQFAAARLKELGVTEAAELAISDFREK